MLTDFTGLTDDEIREVERQRFEAWEQQRQEERRQRTRQQQAARRTYQKVHERLEAATATVQAAEAARVQAEQTRVALMAEAHQAGWSCAQIAAATGLSRSRVHQLLQAHGAAPTT
jgi:hypothetical protein